MVCVSHSPSHFCLLPYAENIKQLVSDPATMKAIAQKIAAQLNSSSASAVLE